MAFLVVFSLGRLSLVVAMSFRMHVGESQNKSVKKGSSIVLVLLSAHMERVSVSRMQDFFLLKKIWHKADKTKGLLLDFSKKDKAWNLGTLL